MPPAVLRYLNDKFWQNYYRCEIAPKEADVGHPWHQKKCSKIQKSQLVHRTVSVSIIDHNYYHHLFSNLVPVEIVDWLNERYWDGQYQTIIDERSIKPPH
ncbi:MAG: hypothetical protein ABH841_00345 [Candidatus Nealsonbacteria bacterium]